MCKRQAPPNRDLPPETRTRQQQGVHFLHKHLPEALCGPGTAPGHQCVRVRKRHGAQRALHPRAWDRSLRTGASKTCFSAATSNVGLAKANPAHPLAHAQLNLRKHPGTREERKRSQRRPLLLPERPGKEHTRFQVLRALSGHLLRSPPQAFLAGGKCCSPPQPHPTSKLRSFEERERERPTKTDGHKDR